MKMCITIYICMCVCVYIYRERERKRFGGGYIRTYRERVCVWRYIDIDVNI